MDLIGKMRSSVRFCINTPTAQGAGGTDNYGVLLTTRGWLRKSSGNRSLVFGEIAAQSSFVLMVRYQQAITANISISTKLIIDNIWHTVDSWQKKEEGLNFYYEFKLNRKEPVTSSVVVLPQAGTTGLQPALYLETIPNATSVNMGVSPSEIVLVARSGLVYTKVASNPGTNEYTETGGLLLFSVPFNSGEIVYVLYKTSS
jgi:hypothetical protein